jgi:hypothetical protein
MSQIGEEDKGGGWKRCVGIMEAMNPMQPGKCKVYVASPVQDKEGESKDTEAFRKEGTNVCHTAL